MACVHGCSGTCGGACEALWHACDKGSIADTEAALARGAGFDYRGFDDRKIQWGEPPIVQAADKGFLHIVKFLLDHGDDVNRRNNVGYDSLDLIIRRADPQRPEYEEVYSMILTHPGLKMRHDRILEVLEERSAQCYELMYRTLGITTGDAIQLHEKLVYSTQSKMLAGIDPNKAMGIYRASKAHIERRAALATKLGAAVGCSLEELARLCGKQLTAAVAARPKDELWSEFVVPKAKPLSFDAQLVLKEFDSLILGRVAWNEAQKTGLIELTSSVMAYLSDEISRASRNTGVLLTAYMRDRQTHKRAYEVVLSMIRAEPGWTDSQAILRSWCLRLADTAPEQPNVTSMLQLYEGAMRVRERYEAFMKTIASKTGATYVKANPKGIWRVLEKIALRKQGVSEDTAVPRICDLTRGMLSCANMTQLTLVAMVLDGCDVASSAKDLSMTGERIELLRCKDRFFAPTLGGWADAMINFAFFDGQTGGKHICEVQLAHEQLVFVRAEWGAHKAFGTFRNAIELLEASGNAELVYAMDRASDAPPPTTSAQELRLAEQSAEISRLTKQVAELVAALPAGSALKAARKPSQEVVA